MCLIIVKKIGKPMPTDAILSIAFDNNPDGFGMAYTEPDWAYVRIIKGAMSKKRMFKMIAQIPQPKKKCIVFHFRYATEGQVKPGNCHPFPLSNRDEDLDSLSITTPMAIAHNGMIWDTGEDWEDIDNDDGLAVYSWRMQVNQSDTQKYIKNYLWGMGSSLFNRQVCKLIQAHSNSKFIFLSPAKFMILGDFYHKDELLFSNQSYLPGYYDVKEVVVAPQRYTCEVCGELSDEQIPFGGAQVCANCLVVMMD